MIQIPDCPQCETSMCLIDETARLVEFRCEACYSKETVWKNN